jgi:hypothetical protein
MFSSQKINSSTAHPVSTLESVRRKLWVNPQHAPTTAMPKYNEMYYPQREVTVLYLLVETWPWVAFVCPFAMALS